MNMTDETLLDALGVDMEDLGYEFDGAESDRHSKGYSCFRVVGGRELYSFVFFDQHGMEAYVSHDDIGDLGKGTFEGCSSDGCRYLTVSLTDVSSDNVRDSIRKLWVAAEKFSNKYPAKS